MNTPDVTAAKKLQELKEQQAVIQAYLDGKTIECRLKCHTGDAITWHTTVEPAWAFTKLDYRVKKEPRTFYVVSVGNSSIVTYTDKACAERAAKYYGEPIITVKEVLPEDN